ncbi:MAG: hypothetical protein IKV46_07480 [Bacteroidales bacterium]|nr:hypothetical protein [Bacteroidales bacterium]
MKKILIFTLLISVSFVVSAQRKNYRTIDVFNNTVEFSVSGGVHALHLVQETPVLGLKDEIKPAVQVGIGYQFSPILGTRFALQGGNTMSALSDTLLPNSVIAGHVDLLVSLTNFWKTKAKRKYYDAQIVFGVGALSFRPENEQDQFAGFAINGGLINSFFLTKNLLLNIEMKLFLTNDAFPVDYYYNYGGWAMLYDASLGLSYRIPTDQKNKRYSGRR